MFENDDLKKSSKVPSLVLSIGAGLVGVAMVANITNSTWPPIIVGVVVGIIVNRLTKQPT